MTAPENTPVRFGVIGLGVMGERHCRVLTAHKGAELSAVCDHHAELVSETAKQFGAKAYLDYSDMLLDSTIDAVVICLPSSLHSRFGIAAAKASKHVIVEKPIDSRSIEAMALMEACVANIVQCAVISQNRFSTGLQILKQAITSGIMGSPVLARATVKWYRHDPYYTESHWRGKLEGEHGGVLINQAVHSIDTLQWLFGVPDHISGFVHSSRPEVLETEDTAVALFKWKEGLVATLEACTAAAPGFDEAYEIHSPIASARVEKGQLVYWYHADGVQVPVPPETELPTDLDPKLSLFYKQYQNILDAICKRAPLEVSASEAIEVVRTVERIYQVANAAELSPGMPS